MKMATIEEARRRAEERKAELEALKAAQRASAVAVDRTPVGGGSNPFRTSGPGDTAGGGAAVDPHGEELRRQRERFSQRQKLPEVRDAGKPNAQDEKIRLFEEAKAKCVVALTAPLIAATPCW